MDAARIDQRFNFLLGRLPSRIASLAIRSRAKHIGRQLNISNGVILVEANSATKIIGGIVELNEHIDTGRRRFRLALVGNRGLKGFWRNRDRRSALSLLNNNWLWSYPGGNFNVGLGLLLGRGWVGSLVGRRVLGPLFGLLFGHNLGFGLFRRNGILPDGVVHLIDELSALHRLVCAGTLREHGHVQEREHQQYRKQNRQELALSGVPRIYKPRDAPHTPHQPSPSFLLLRFRCLNTGFHQILNLVESVYQSSFSLLETDL
ncbi:hypothetical protein NSA09_00850 [Adlercreutzia mucosicola]|nr:hypothetical protein [Adlercreutzia mucosicola]